MEERPDIRVHESWSQHRHYTFNRDADAENRQELQATKQSERRPPPTRVARALDRTAEAACAHMLDFCSNTRAYLQAVEAPESTDAGTHREELEATSRRGLLERAGLRE